MFFFQVFPSQSHRPIIIYEAFKIIILYLKLQLLCFYSLLSGGSDGTIAIHDLEDLRESEHNMLDSRVYKLVCSVSPGNRNAHRRSIETVQWYPLDTGIFTSSGADRVLKIWDANSLKVHCLKIKCLVLNLPACFFLV